MVASKQVPTPTKHPGGYPPHRSNPIAQHSEHVQHPTNGQCCTRRWQSHRHPNDASSVRGTPTPLPTPTPAPVCAWGSTPTPPPTCQPTHPVSMPRHPNRVKCDHVTCDHVRNQQYCRLCPNASGHCCPTSHPSLIYRCPCGIVVRFSVLLPFEGGGFREPWNSVWAVNIGRTNTQGNHPKGPVAPPHPKDPKDVPTQ
jgi:hypothetical protein